MWQCNVCGSRDYQTETISEVFVIEGKRVLVEGIPARVCSRCGDGTYSRETAENVRRMVHGAAQPVGTVQMDVFAYG